LIITGEDILSLDQGICNNEPYYFGKMKWLTSPKP